MNSSNTLCNLGAWLQGSIPHHHASIQVQGMACHDGVATKVEKNLPAPKGEIFYICQYSIELQKGSSLLSHKKDMGVIKLRKSSCKRPKDYI